MADNFNLRQYLYENNLGAYSKTKLLKEGIVKMTPSSTGDGEMTVHLTTNQGEKYTLEVNVINEDEIEVVSGTDATGRSLAESELFELQLDYEREIAARYYQEYAEDIEMSKLAGTGKVDMDKLGYSNIPEVKKHKDAPVHEALEAAGIDRIEGLVDNRRMSVVFDTLEEILEDLEGEGFDREDIAAYLQMRLTEFLG